MSIEIAVRHGPYTFRVNEADVKTAVSRMSTLQELPTYCPRCNARWRFDVRVVDKYTFYSLRCLGEEEHKVDLGQYQDDSRQLYFDKQKPWLTQDEIKQRGEQRGGMPR